MCFYDPWRAQCTLLEPSVRELIAATERFYARLLRLDRGWRTGERDAQPPGAIARLRERLALGATA